MPDGVSGTTHLTVGSAGATKEKGGFDTTGAHGNFSVARFDAYGYIRLDSSPERINIEFVRTNPGRGQPAKFVFDAFTVAPWK